MLGSPGLPSPRSSTRGCVAFDDASFPSEAEGAGEAAGTATEGLLDSFRRRSRVVYMPHRQNEVAPPVLPAADSCSSGALAANRATPGGATQASQARRQSGVVGQVDNAVNAMRRRSVKAGAVGGAPGAKASPKAGGASASGAHAKAMTSTAALISKQVHSLYKSAVAADEDGVSEGAACKGGSAVKPGALAHTTRRLSLLGDNDDSKQSQAAEEPGAGEGLSSEETSSGSEGHDHLAGLDENSDGEDSGSDDYDFKQAASKVTGLLEALNSETRTDLMTQLNNFYATRKTHVDEDLKSLAAYEEDYQGREEETKNSMAMMLQTFEAKQMREVNVLVKCNNTLKLGAAQRLKKRQRFAAHAKLASPKSGGSTPKRSSILRSRGQNSDDEGSSASTPISEKALKPRASVCFVDNQDESGNEREQPTQGPEATEDQPLEENFDIDKEQNNSETGTLSGALAIISEDGFDIEAARRKLKEMHDAPQHILAQLNSDEPPAAEILNTLAQVQQAQVQLEAAAGLAMQQCDTLRGAVEHLNAPKDEEPSAAVIELIQTVKTQVFGEGGDEGPAGPDPEELEEECRQLEKLVAQQEEQIEVINRQRNRTMKLEQDIADAAYKEDGSGDEAEKQPTLLKSELRDGRLEAARAAADRTAQPVSPAHACTADKKQTRSVNAATRFRNALANRRSLNKQEPAEEEDNANKLEGETAVQSLAVQSNRQVQTLQASLDEKNVRIEKAKEILQRMRKEYALLQHCATLSESGLEAILNDFRPGDLKVSDVISDSDSDEEEDSKEGRARGGECHTKGESKDDTALVYERIKKDATDFCKTSTRGSLTNTVRLVLPEPEAESSGKSKKRGSMKSPRVSSGPPVQAVATPQAEISDAPVGSAGGVKKDSDVKALVKATDGHGRTQLGQFKSQVTEYRTQRLEQEEHDMKQKIEHLNAKIKTDTRKIKIEKGRQKALTKENKQLRKQFAQLAKKRKGVPTTVEGLEKQMATYADAEVKANQHINVLREELARQQRILTKARADAEEREAAIATQATITGTKAGIPDGQPIDAALPGTTAVDAAPARGDLASGVAATGEHAGGPAVAAGAGASSAGAATVGVGVAKDCTGTAIRGADGSEAAKAGADGARATGAISTGAGATMAGVTVSETAEAARAGAAKSGSVAPSPGKETPHAQERSPAGSRVHSGLVRRQQSTETHSAVGSTPSHLKVSGCVIGPDKHAGIAQEDLTELVRLQSQNEQIKSEIDEIMTKMQQLRKAMKRGKSMVMSKDAIRQIIGDSIETAEVKPPPEYYQLKKEVRARQREVRNLRKKWWVDHKDLELLTEKARLTGAPAHIATLPNGHRECQWGTGDVGHEVHGHSGYSVGHQGYVDHPAHQGGHGSAHTTAPWVQNAAVQEAILRQSVKHGREGTTRQENGGEAASHDQYAGPYERHGLGRLNLYRLSSGVLGSGVTNHVETGQASVPISRDPRSRYTMLRGLLGGHEHIHQVHTLSDLVASTADPDGVRRQSERVQSQDLCITGRKSLLPTPSLAAPPQH